MSDSRVLALVGLALACLSLWFNPVVGSVGLIYSAYTVIKVFNGQGGIYYNAYRDVNPTHTHEEYQEHLAQVRSQRDARIKAIRDSPVWFYIRLLILVALLTLSIYILTNKIHPNI